MKLDKTSVIGIVVAVLLLVSYIIYGNVNKGDSIKPIKGGNLSIAPMQNAEKITIKTDLQGRVSLGAE